MKIAGTNNQSKCSLCGSTSYGRTCPYGPKHAHVHTDDPTRCVFCGSTNIGPTCPLNPYSKHHQKGIAVLPLALESVESGIIQGLLMKRLSTPITEMAAYHLGLIDDSGKIIREPTTIQERNALTKTDKYIIRLKRLFESELDMLNSTLYFESSEEDYTIDELKRMHPIELEYEDAIEENIKNLLSVVLEYAKKGLSQNKIERIISEKLFKCRNEHGLLGG